MRITCTYGAPIHRLNLAAAIQREARNKVHDTVTRVRLIATSFRLGDYDLSKSTVNKRIEAQSDILIQHQDHTK